MPGNIGDFKELVENSNGLFVDKSLFIKEIIDSKTDPLLITRPRRWGKTLNMNMLFYFFVHGEQLKGMGKNKDFIEQCDALFKDLNILKANSDLSVAKHMRQYPVIYISFSLSGDDSNRHSNEPDWEKVKIFVVHQIAALFSQFHYLAEDLKKIIDQKSNQELNRELDQKIVEYKNRFNVENLSDVERVKIYEEATQYRNIVQSIFQEQKELEKFYRLRDKKPADDAELSESINFLTQLLYRFHGKQVYVLIDEYDSLINRYFEHQNILNKLTSTFSGIFSAFAKPTGVINDHIQKVIFTGILRVAKANIFSRLNNLQECTVLDPEFSKYYGFTEKEVNELIVKAKITVSPQAIRDWYNGYTIGDYTIYNPWSIMRCITRGGILEPYWVDTADPSIIRSLLVERSSIEYKINIRNLIKHNQVELKDELEKRVSFDDLISNPDIIWSILVHTGYLTLVTENDKQHVRVPNQEIKKLLRKYVDNWFTSKPMLSKAANSLLIGDLLNFKAALTEIVDSPAYSARIFSGGTKGANTASTIKLKEFIYQFLIMTELRCVTLDPKAKDYEISCEPDNVSIGKTRPDFLVINHKRKLCVIGELKVSDQKGTPTPEDLEKLAEDQALTQIDHNKYAKNYENIGYQLIKVGIAFKGSNFGMAYRLPDQKKTSKIANIARNKAKLGDSKRSFSTMVPLFQQKLSQPVPNFYFKPKPVTNIYMNMGKLLNILRKIPKP